MSCAAMKPGGARATASRYTSPMPNVILKALRVLTSHDRLGETGYKTGFWYDEMSAPCWALADAGFSVEIASVNGGAAPHDPGGVCAETRSAATTLMAISQLP